MSDANRLDRLVVTIRASVGRAEKLLEETKQHLPANTARSSSPIDWMALTTLLYQAQSALMAPASLAYEEWKAQERQQPFAPEPEDC